MSFSLSLINSSEVDKQFDRLVGSAEPERYADVAAGFILDANRKRFLAETDPEGKPWIPSLAGQRRRARGDTGTLFASGRMFHSIQIRREGTASRTVGTANVPYARKHQEGTGGMVRRVFLGVADEDVSKLRGLVVNLLEKGLGK